MIVAGLPRAQGRSDGVISVTCAGKGLEVLAPVLRPLVLAVVLLSGCSTTAPLASFGGNPTTQPGAASQAADSAEPTEAPVSFKAITASGRGSKVVKFTIPEDVPAIATISNRGRSNFIVEALAKSGETNSLLVNEIGNYSGTVIFDTSSGEHSVALKIESDGTWRVVIKPIVSARSWSGSGRLTGKGDDVVRVSPATSGLFVVTITHAGRANFIVTAYSADGTDLLVNEIGRYSGETTLPDGTLLIEVEADGSWMMTPE
jgi:hypothetical protein